MTEQMISGPSGELFTRVDGPEGAPWIVLSNSLGASSGMWRPQIDMLTGHYRVLRYDTRGHGRSATPPGDWSFDDLVADVIAVMDAHDVTRADFLGLSLGGMTGLGVALRHPERLRRLVVADARADAPEAFRENFLARLRKVEAGGIEAIADATLETWFTEAWRQANPDELAKVRAMILGTDPAGYVRCCHTLRTLDYLKDLGRITIPVLYLGGDRDAGAPPDVMHDMADATPRGQFELIPDAAHVSNISNPHVFNCSVERFLTGAQEITQPAHPAKFVPQGT
ncbi:3-oxoadipate enol-lactonase [Alkalilacustris brevis]|uniref:3-oxoadipate enol-lactonase n=1 Tax=Alkalilacustris brevis TaxID=2026338 RepID=UPI000E0DA70E|nr:3-oxoadipate enol-lactonase [Alkalilacustris brevis]